MNSPRDTLTLEQSRGGLLRAAALSAIAAVPGVAALASARGAHAKIQPVQCYDLVCSCTGCLSGCYGEGFACSTACYDAYNGQFCWMSCSNNCPQRCSAGC
jgi:hypothetical protein